MEKCVTRRLSVCQRYEIPPTTGLHAQNPFGGHAIPFYAYCYTVRRHFSVQNIGEVSFSSRERVLNGRRLSIPSGTFTLRGSQNYFYKAPHIYNRTCDDLIYINVGYYEKTGSESPHAISKSIREPRQNRL